MYAKLKELTEELRLDSYSLTDNERNMLLGKIEELKSMLDEFYSQNID